MRFFPCAHFDVPNSLQNGNRISPIDPHSLYNSVVSTNLSQVGFVRVPGTMTPFASILPRQLLNHQRTAADRFLPKDNAAARSFTPQCSFPASFLLSFLSGLCDEQAPVPRTVLLFWRFRFLFHIIARIALFFYVHGREWHSLRCCTNAYLTTNTP